MEGDECVSMVKRGCFTVGRLLGGSMDVLHIMWLFYGDPELEERW